MIIILILNNNKLRIAFDYQIFCHQSYGGISRYYVQLVEQMILLMQEVKIFAPFHQNKYLKELDLKLVSGYELPIYLPKTNHIMLMLNCITSKYSINKWKPQLVHETNYSKITSTPKYCPSIVTVYDMIHELFPMNPHDHTSRLKREAVKRATHIICISENTKNDLIRLFGTDTSKISVVHLGCSAFICNSNNLSNIIINQKPYILYVGRRTGYKNFNLFIEAFCSSTKLKRDFNILAFGGGEFTSHELKYFSILGLQTDQVKQIGGDDLLLGNAYRQASAFINPSVYEGFGLSPLEAMSNNCPVISSNTSTMPEVIGDAAEYFDPNQIEDIASAIKKVLYSPSRSNDLINRGQKRIKNFTWRSCAESTLMVYKSVV